MRILSGKLSGRVLHRPKTDLTRPMSDKVRAALFNILGDISGWRVLDAYAGSGAIGFEALSRDAGLVDAIEVSRTVSQTIKRSATELETSSYQLFVGKVEDWLKRSKQRPYDLIVADPPYDQLDDQILSQLATYLDGKGVMVVSHSSRTSSPELESLKLVDNRKYGDSALSLYRHT